MGYNYWTITPGYVDSDIILGSLYAWTLDSDTLSKVRNDNCISEEVIKSKLVTELYKNIIPEKVT